MAVRVRVPLAALFYLLNFNRSMNKSLILSLSVGALTALSSCSGKMGALSADYFTVNPNPLETVGGEVPATINGVFPEKYMKKKAVVTVVPELRYGGGRVVRGQGASFQGESVMGNDQSISYRLGGRYTMKTNFDYTPDMQSSEMYLTFDARIGNKTVKIPAVKVADGVIATSELYRQTLINGGACIAPDSFQRVNAMKQEANVRFLVNQANLRQSELKNNSVQEFVKLLKRINADREQLNIQNVEVSAYASPEGGFDFNDKLANKRQTVSEGYVKQQLKNTKVEAPIDAHYTAQDWEGFQQLVLASNIQDKDVILRVLSMYKDPQERERQIRNMSEGFRELADEVLPELRRSRLTINYETIGRDDAQIKAQYVADPAKLSLEELLYAATLEESTAKQAAIYKKTTELYDKDYRAYNNLGVLAFNEGNNAAAADYFRQAQRVDSKAPEAFANQALMALQQGNVKEAEAKLSEAVNANGFNEVMGNLNIAKGNFAQAAENLKNSDSNSTALAQLLNKDYAAATLTLKSIKHPDAMTSYLHAIISARMKNKYASNSYLKEALEKDASLSKYAEKDLEFAKVR